MRTPRKDQLRNRQRLLAAAREAFVVHGPEVSLEEIARGAAVGPTTLYRHFPTKDDLVEAVLDDLIQGVLQNAERAARIEDPREAFRLVFTQSCDMPEKDVTAFARLAAVSRRTEEHATRLIAAVVGPATTRLREAGGLREDITTDDIVMFVRMADVCDTPARRAKALEIISTGLSLRGGAGDDGAEVDAGRQARHRGS